MLLSDQKRTVEDLPSEPELPFIVALGASAGGLEAITRFFDHVPHDTGAVFVLVQHLSPDFKSLMPSLLAKHTTMPIRLVEQGEAITPDTVYLIPPAKDMTLTERQLNIADRKATQVPHLPINTFFESIATHARERVVSIILSGTGSDGTKGVKAVKEAGGFVLVQEPDSAEYDGMPINAIATGLADVVAEPKELAHRLTDFLREPSISIRKQLLASTKRRTSSGDPLQDLFHAMKDRTGVDFSLYKPSTVHRRIERRIAVTQAQSVAEYYSYCMESPTELRQLFRELLINVTGFFRDPEAFKILNKECIEPLVQSYEGGEPARIWVPGCATGEEAYSIAILLEEAKEKFHVEDFEFKVFATDVSEEIIQVATKSHFTEGACADLSSDRIQRFFRREGENFVPKMHLRDRMVFVTHNVICDPPFTRIDLVSCRNMLIYFDSKAQNRALACLHFAVKPQGVLWLGPSESLGLIGEDFEVLESRWKFYRKRNDRKLPLQLEQNSVPTLSGYPRFGRRRPTADNLDLVRFYSIFAAEYLSGCFILDEHYDVVQMLGNAPRWLSFNQGQPSFNILKMTQGNFRLALSSLLHRLKASRQPVDFASVDISGGGSSSERVALKGRFVEGTNEQPPCLIVLVEEGKAIEPLVPRTNEEFDVSAEMQHRTAHLERELDATRENLQATIEELETTNEELQSTNEELMASNEELQSSNEELHAVNEELYTVNAEHQTKIAQLTDLSNDMENILSSSAVATLFVDRHMCIRKFTPAVREVLNVLPQDLGRPLGDLTHSLDGLKLLEVAGRVVSESETESMEVSGKGRWFAIHASPYRTESGAVEGVVINFTDISERRKAENQLKELTEKLRVQAQHDYLTGLLNRRGLAHELSREVSSMDRSGSQLCAVLIDCDEFKEINDKLGHSVGDVVLKEVAKRLSETLRPTDHVGRLGGDEFLVFAPAIRVAEAQQLAERLRLAVSGTPFYAPEPVRVTASLGVASIPRGQNSLETIITRTQGVLKASKRGGRNRVSINVGGRITSESGFPTHDLVKGDGISLLRQPIVNVDSGDTVGYELLSRGPEGPLHFPDALFRACMDKRILTQVDTRCLEMALHWTAGQPDELVHINLFPSTLLDLNPDRIEELFGEKEVGKRVCIELSEQQFLGDPLYLKEPVDEMRRWGVQVAIDDVGFGRSSLEALIVLEPEIVKIDKSYVLDCHQSMATRRSLKRLVNVIRSIDAKIVAEGVETEDDRMIVSALGIHHAQGYLWSRPFAVAEE